MNRRQLLKTTAAALLSSAASRKAIGLQSSKTTKPNVLLLLTDQQTVKAMSCAGNRYVKTPALDQLAARGVRFERSYCTAPICGPSRSSLITGRMPHETGVNYNVETPKAEIPNLGQLFRVAGYRTVWAGKWHLPRMFPHKFDPEQKEIPGFELMHFFDFSLPRWGEGSVTDPPLTEAVLRFMREERQDQPLLLVVSYHNPHDICYVPLIPKRFPPLELVDLPPLPANHGVEEEESEFIEQRRTLNRYGNQVLLTQDWSEKQWRDYIYRYYRLVEDVDAEIGKLLAAMEAQGKVRDTVVAFTSDHGEGLGAHKWSTKLCFYEEAVAVPFILSWPGRIPEGTVDSTHLVSGLDVVPTLCDLAGVPAPQPCRGASLRKAIGQSGDWRDFLVVELADDDKDHSRKGRVVVTSRYKYAVYSQGARPEELFDLSKDPGETRNLAYDPSLREVKQEHRRKLEGWIKETRDEFRFPA
jgi:arylsulfatase A-like enzyme